MPGPEHPLQRPRREQFALAGCHRLPPHAGPADAARREVEAAVGTKSVNPKSVRDRAINANDTFHYYYPDQKLWQYDGSIRIQPGIADQEPENEPINGADWRRAWIKQCEFADYYAARPWMVAMFDVPFTVGSGPWEQFEGLPYPAPGVIHRGFGVSGPAGDGTFGD